MRIAVAPQHINHYGSNFKALRRLGTEVVTFTEMDEGHIATGLRQARRQMPNYRFYSHDIGKHSQEVPVALKKSSFDTHVEESTELLHKMVNPGTGNDRYLNEVRWHHRGRPVVVLNTHWMAALQAASDGSVNEHHNQRAAAMVRAYDIIEEKAKKYLNQNDEVIITGDFNYKIAGPWGTHPHALWEHSPQALFRSLGMDWHEDRLDYLAISDGLRFRNIHVVPPEGHVAGKYRWDSDHGLIVADIRWKGSK